MTSGLYTLTHAQRALEQLRNVKRVVLTAGTFDILHPGHVDYLEWCKTQGDLLVVCVIGDQRTRRRKGPGRPIMKEEWRALVVSALKPVDLVFVSNLRPFDERIINAIRPNAVVTSLDEPTKGKKIELESYFKRVHPEIRLMMRSRGSFRRKTSTRMIIQKIKEM